MEHLFELTISHAEAVFSPELASLARHPHVLIPGIALGKRQKEMKTLSSDIEQVCS